MKKIVVTLLCVLLAALLFAGCGESAQTEEPLYMSGNFANYSFIVEDDTYLYYPINQRLVRENKQTGELTVFSDSFTVYHRNMTLLGTQLYYTGFEYSILNTDLTNPTLVTSTSSYRINSDGKGFMNLYDDSNVVPKNVQLGGEYIYSAYDTGEEFRLARINRNDPSVRDGEWEISQGSSASGAVFYVSGDELWIGDESGLVKYDAGRFFSGADGKRLVSEPVDAFALDDDCIAYVSGGALYTADASGRNGQYVGDSEIFNLRDGVLYYMRDGASLVAREVKNGAETVIKDDCETVVGMCFAYDRLYVFAADLGVNNIEQFKSPVDNSFYVELATGLVKDFKFYRDNNEVADDETMAVLVPKGSGFTQLGAYHCDAYDVAVPYGYASFIEASGDAGHDIVFADAGGRVYMTTDFCVSSTLSKKDDVNNYYDCYNAGIVPTANFVLKKLAAGGMSVNNITTLESVTLENVPDAVRYTYLAETVEGNFYISYTFVKGPAFTVSIFGVWAETLGADMQLLIDYFTEQAIIAR